MTDLRQEVREAVYGLDGDPYLAARSSKEWRLCRAELLRLAADNRGMHEALCEHDTLCEQLTAIRLRAEQAEAELAALKARIAAAPLCTVRVSGWVTTIVSSDHDMPPLDGKHVRLLVDEPPIERGEG